MSAAHVPVRADLEELRDRFNKAAFDFPDVDAVVVKLPDLRHEETVRQARGCLGPLMHARLVKPGEPESFTVKEVVESAGCLHEATRWAVQLDTWIPPVHESIEQQGGQVYYVHTDCELIQEASGKSALRHLWNCTVFGPPIRGFDNRAHRLFLMLAADGARLVLNGNGKGDSPRSGWLIHLADRDVPLEVSARQQFLGWSPFDHKPGWIPATPFNSPPDWWAVRLRHVFLLSRAAVEQAIEQATLSPAPAAGGAEQQQGKPLADQISPLARAVAIMMDHQRKHGKLMTVTALLKLMPDTSRTTLYRDPAFAAARAAIRQSLGGTLPKGHTTQGGGVEAEDGDSA